jgi:hypothetical protein
LAARDRRCDGEAGVLRDGLILSSILGGIAPFAGWKGGKMVFLHSVAVLAETPAQG